MYRELWVSGLRVAGHRAVVAGRAWPAAGPLGASGRAAGRFRLDRRAHPGC